MATTFPEAAKGLAKNPLGIIALFISFVYALACLVIGVSTQSLTSIERQPLIWYVILFPVITLGCFMYLVTQHPAKLYAPSDYKDENNFMDTIGPRNLSKFSTSDKNAEESQDIMDIFLNNSSVIGIFALYAVYLSKQHNKSFTLEALQEKCEILDPNYVHGFYVAASCAKLFSFTTRELPFTVNSIDPKIENNIAKRVYTVASEDHEEHKDYLLVQLKNLQSAFADLTPESS